MSLLWAMILNSPTWNFNAVIFHRFTVLFIYPFDVGNDNLVNIKENNSIFQPITLKNIMFD